MKPLFLFLSLCLGAAARIATAQPAINPIATELPLRNLQIEVRQLRDDSTARTTLEAGGSVVLQPGGSAAEIGVTARDDRRDGSRQLMQQVLVLNGRSTHLSLGVTVPLRLVQTFVRNGQVQVIPSTVLIDARSGFNARPLWRGGNEVELELAAAQVAGAASSGMSSSVSSTLAVPLNEWTTVAESDEQAADNGSAITSRAQSTSRTRVQVQVRLSVR